MTAVVTIVCANLKGNLGDYAILEIMGRSFAQHFPGAEIGYFYHANKPVDRERYAQFLKELEIAMTDLGPAPFFRRPAWFRLLTKLPGTRGLSTRIHNALIGRTADRISRNPAFAERLKSSRLVAFAGGAQWGKANLNLNMFAQLKCAARLSERVIAFPFGISRVALDCNGASRLGEMLSQLGEPILVRDVISHRLLRQAGVPAQHVSDCVFTAGDLFRELREPQRRPGKTVYVSVTRSGETTARGIVELFDRLRASGLHPVMFSSCELEDRPLIDAVLALSEETVVAPTSWKSAVRLFADAAFVVTNRLHCLIFSALAGAAVVPVANRQKAQAYAEDAGLTYAPVEIADITENGIRDFLGTLDDVRDKQLRFLTTSAETTQAAIDQVCTQSPSV